MRIDFKLRLVLLAGSMVATAMVFLPVAHAQAPADAPAMKLMAADADPNFEVVTVKPNNSGDLEHNIRADMRRLNIKNMSFKEMIAVVYELQPKQVVGGPDWIEKETWDVSGVPDIEGRPTEDQWKVMLKKMMTDRFHLKYHMEKREMPVYVLSAVKGAAKLTKSESTSPLPGFNTHAKPGAVMIEVHNARMQDLAEYMQVRVLERPVVDQTKLSGRYDFTVTFLPDGSQFNGRMPPEADANTGPAPGLYTAMEEQIGLKLEARKAPANVLVIDGVDKPSEN